MVATNNSSQSRCASVLATVALSQQNDEQTPEFTIVPVNCSQLSLGTAQTQDGDHVHQFLDCLVLKLLNVCFEVTLGESSNFHMFTWDHEFMDRTSCCQVNHERYGPIKSHVTTTPIDLRFRWTKASSGTMEMKIQFRPYFQLEQVI